MENGSCLAKQDRESDQGNLATGSPDLPQCALPSTAIAACPTRSQPTGLAALWGPAGQALQRNLFLCQ